MNLTTGFTLSVLLLSAVTLTACDKSTPTYPGAVKTTDDQSSVVPVAGSAVPVAISDANINNDVKTALLRDDDLKNFDINVVSTKGDVRLTGELDSQNQINQAILIAEGVVGVKTVYDELTVKR
ncbi:BON domain-containing protein [Rheinheimera soli]|jgi:hyperosmotically inducible protein|uniref:Osmotically-inducible protein OsmY n=1 Tax=Rheinheimera soli TaxID=443616 RepID=A0ABU1W238_9GAMM|nr:BON domain-containing protein [Rheinheimera soli]MDR7122036.1 osmotically-inducible protein OsmY [Rheinheimera soli]